MARNWINILIILFITVILSGTGSAQDDILTTADEQWIYTEMEILHGEGLLVNYPCDWVRSGNKLTRFEVAYYIKQLLASELESAQWRDKSVFPRKITEAIQKLVSEFRKELTALGVKITDIYAISPNLEESGTRPNDYQDLDVILSSADTAAKQDSYYYFGQYIKGIYRKSFLFIPLNFVKDDNINLLQGTYGTINIVYHQNKKENPTFLVVKGNLPVDSRKDISGYYLFPLDDGKEVSVKNNLILSSKLNDSVLDLLDEVNQGRRIENLWKFNGSLSLKGYRKMETYLQSRFKDFNNSLKIGGFLIDTANYAKSDLLEFGLPFLNSHQSVVDLDTINRNDLQSFQINIQGNMALNSKTLITGGLDLIYRDTKSGWEALWPSDAKASAGIQYQLNDYWAVLSYQSFVNSQLESGSLSTTSLGVEYNKWITLWLAYQILSFDDPRITGGLTFRF